MDELNEDQIPEPQEIDRRLLEEARRLGVEQDRRAFEQLPEYRKRAARQWMMRIQRQHEDIMNA